MATRLRNLAEEPPCEWDAGHLGDVCRTRTRQVSPADVAETSYVGLEHMVPGRRYIDAWGSSGDVESAKFRFERGDVLFGKLRPYLRKVSMAPHEGVCSTDILVLAPGQTDDGDFLLYLCQSERVLQFAIATSGGTRMPRTAWSDLRDCPILLPPSEERRRIAAILRSVDEAIERTEAVIAALREVKRGMMQELLTKGVGEDGQVRDPEAHPEEFHETKLGLLPRAWEVSSVGHEFDIAAGFTLGPDRRPQDIPRRYLRVANVQRGLVLLDDVKELEATDAEFAAKQLQAGDLLIVEGHANPDEIGRCAMVPSEAAGMTFQNHLFRLRPKRVDRQFSLLWLNGQRARAYWRAVCGTSSGLNTINRQMLKAMRLPLPAPEEQRTIVALVGAHEAAEGSSQAELTSLQTLKRGLMQQLLTGKVRVKA